MHYLDELATEILSHIFSSCSSTADILNLASTCHRFRSLYTSRRLTFLSHALEAEFGPLQDAVQVVTHNASQPAHIPRSVPISFALIKDILRVGRVAKRWETIYPFKKWRDNYEDRRLLTNDECYILRRAIYRLWLYSRAFHNSQHSRYSRLQHLVVLERAKLLHNWTTSELGEIADVRQVMREVISGNICPSNGTISRKFRKIFPDTNYQLLFNMHPNYPPPARATTSSQHYFTTHTPAADKYYAKYHPTALHNPGDEGWGDDVGHYYVVEDMSKLDPEQILLLRDGAPSKADVELYVKELGEWFENNGETFGQTLEVVLKARGEDSEEFLDGVREGDMGVAVLGSEMW